MEGTVRLNWTNAVINLLILVAPVALLISVVIAIKEIRRESADRRDALGLCGVLFILTAVVLWPIVRKFAPPLPMPTDATYFTACHRAHRYLEIWRGVGIVLCVCGLLSSSFARVRVIVPVLIASVGTVLFWWVSTAGVR
jgi:hypothetical protein